MRNLTKTITAISLLAPVSAFPLGIGDIKLHSALNQNLNAEIALFVSAGENVSDINVKLAPPEKFDEAGVPWNYFLSKIKFETIKAADGSTIIKVSSKEALREPFLDFLVEVSWDKGNLYREFTVLVDPPVAYTQAVIPVVQKPDEFVEAKPAEKTTIAKVNTKKLRKVVKGTFSNGEYGPTKRNDSLWKVADKTNTYGDVTRAQMMMAIYKANPNAFYKDNVNALEAGKTLKIPEKEVILSLSKEDAQLAFKAQADQWTGIVNTNLDNTPVIEAQVQLTAPTEAQVTDNTVVVSTNDEKVDPQRNGTEGEKNDLPSLSPEESFAMQAKMEKLEQQLAMVQKMLVLKDEQIAALQNQNKVKNTPEIEVKPAEGSDKTIEPKKDPVVNDKKPAVKEAPIVDEKAKEKDKEAKVEAEEVSPEQETLSTPMLSAIVFPILGLLGWALWRKGREEDEDAIDDDSIFASASEIIPLDSLADDEEESGTSSDKMSSLEDPMEDSSFLNEFSSSDFHTFDKDLSEDVDPVLEADVYLAYGRYQQAEELMRQAIVDQPERDECKLKLLEIFHAHENKSGFEKYVVELEKSGKNKDQSFWSKVVEMGDELDVKSSSDENIATKNEIDDSDSNDTKIVEEETLKDDGNEMEFDLSIFDEDEKDQKLEKEASNENDANNIDFDLSEFQLNASNSTDGDKDSNINEEFETFDFDFDKLSEKDSEEGALDLTDMDEMETKIDLAKAYIDMGDYDAAKAIAQEAFEKGSDEQKLAAQDILDLLD